MGYVICERENWYTLRRGDWVLLDGGGEYEVRSRPVAGVLDGVHPLAELRGLPLSAAVLARLHFLPYRGWYRRVGFPYEVLPDEQGYRMVERSKGRVVRTVAVVLYAHDVQKLVRRVRRGDLLEVRMQLPLYPSDLRDRDE